MIVDAFTFFNEIDVLSLRLEELCGSVDMFVIVEAGSTFAGHEKRMIFDENRHIFSRFNNKIVHVKIPHLPQLVEDTTDNRFSLEAVQRNGILEGLNRLNLDSKDVVLISDVDEIPRPSIIEYLKSASWEVKAYTLSQKFHKFYFDSVLNDGYNNREWGGTVACQYDLLKFVTPQDIRRSIGLGGELASPSRIRSRGGEVLFDAGWHLSSFGGPTAQAYKVKHYSHGANRKIRNDLPTNFEVERSKLSDLEPCSPANKERILNYIVTRGPNCFPETLLRNIEKFSYFFELNS